MPPARPPRKSAAAASDAFATPKRKRPGQSPGLFACVTPLALGARVEDARPRADALVVGRDVELLVRRMHPIVVERKADEQRVHAQHVLEVADDRDRAARADRDGLVAPLFG